MIACAGISLPFGIWVLTTGRWPSWMRGSLKWPLGDHITADVVQLQGWANFLIGIASLILALLLASLPWLSSTQDVPVKLTVGAVLTAAVAILIAGVIPYARSIRMSRA